ncbi:hypothetical protein NC652_004815 [Populus alba x Populus x berolinensis]|nr:hypothetical protein NC652_004815 [Populus alba x Populus x berolinensis]
MKGHDYLELQGHAFAPSAQALHTLPSCYLKGGGGVGGCGPSFSTNPHQASTITPYDSCTSQGHQASHSLLLACSSSPQLLLCQVAASQNTGTLRCHATTEDLILYGRHDGLIICAKLIGGREEMIGYDMNVRSVHLLEYLQVQIEIRDRRFLLIRKTCGCK